MRHGVFPRRGRPAVHLEPSLNAPLHVEVPLAQIGLERQRLDGDPNLRRPPLCGPLRRRLPDAVPIGVLALSDGINQAVIAAPLGLMANTYPDRPSMNGS